MPIDPSRGAVKGVVPPAGPIPSNFPDLGSPAPRRNKDGSLRKESPEKGPPPEWQRDHSYVLRRHAPVKANNRPVDGTWHKQDPGKPPPLQGADERALDGSLSSRIIPMGGPRLPAHWGPTPQAHEIRKHRILSEYADKLARAEFRAPATFDRVISPAVEEYHVPAGYVPARDPERSALAIGVASRDPEAERRTRKVRDLYRQSPIVGSVAASPSVRGAGKRGERKIPDRAPIDAGRSVKDRISLSDLEIARARKAPPRIEAAPYTAPIRQILAF